MRARFRSFFKPVHTLPLQIFYEMDVDEQGKHIVHVYKQVGDRHERVGKIRDLWVYGYKEELETDQGQYIYILGEDDRQALLALKSLNPEYLENGALRFDIEPPVLLYLRRIDNLKESQAAQEVQVSSQPLKPTARIEYLPDKGLRVETGYASSDSGRLLRPQELKKTRDGKYARIGNVFAPLKEISAKAIEILERPVTRVSVKNIPEYIQRDLVLIKKEYNAVLTDLASQLQVVDVPFEPKVRVNKDTSGWLDFQVSYEAAGCELPQGLLSSKEAGSYVQVSENTWVKVDKRKIQETQEKLEQLGAVPSEDGYRLPPHEFVSLEEFIADIGGTAQLTKAYQDFLEKLTGFEADENFRLSEGFEEHLENQKLILRPYQRAGIHWLTWLRQNHLHGVLADDMGLGKTLQSLAALRLAYEETESTYHSLIISPKSVVHHWEREIKRSFPEIRVHVYHGQQRRTSIFNSSLPYIILSTYETVQRDVDELSKIPFFYLILDEATKIKNPDSRRTQAIKALNAAHRLALSGTPVENRPAELWSLFDFLMRGHLGRYGTFVRVFEENILLGKQAAADQLGRRIRPFLLRRTKDQVAKDLPEKIILDEWCGLTLEQRQLYGGLQDEVKRLRLALRQGESVNYTTSILPVLTRLKQICDHPGIVTKSYEPLYGRSEKYDWIMDKIEEITTGGEQVVVFSHFLDMLNLIEKGLKGKEISYIRIDGSTHNRQALIDHFNAGKAQAAVLSIMAAGHGINLTSANHVIHADRWWNPAVEDQATDRVHRIGQNRTVYVYHILTEGTLEERIDTLLESKRAMADQIVGAAVEGARQWTREELIELLRPLD
jgi:SNF2 family DNA or RNA helicase